MKINLIILQRAMQFSQDKISDFIRFKLNNPHALQEEMKLIEDRLECNRKLQDYTKEMQSLKNQLSNGKSTLQALVARREYIVNVSDKQKFELQTQTSDCRQQIQNIKKDTKEKQNSSQFYQKRYEQFQKDIMIKKQALIQIHQQELTKLDEQTENLQFQKEARATFKEQLEYKLKKMRDREKIIKNAEQNVQSIKNKWTTRYHELVVLKEEQQKKEKEINDLINYSHSMQKVIYNNLYKRCSSFIDELKQGLDNLYNEKTVNMSEIGWQQRVQKQISKLKTHKQRFAKLLKEKRDKYSISSGLPQANADEYNLIVQTKINPEMLQYIDLSKYTINEQKYYQIEQAQNAQLDKLQAKKVQLESKQTSKISEIQNLQKRIAALQQQIQIKQKALMSPPKKKK